MNTDKSNILRAKGGPVLAVCLLFFLLLPASRLSAQSSSAVDTSTDILMFAPGAVGAGVSLLKGDYNRSNRNSECGIGSAAVICCKGNPVKNRSGSTGGRDRWHSGFFLSVHLTAGGLAAILYT